MRIKVLVSVFIVSLSLTAQAIEEKKDIFGKFSLKTLNTNNESQAKCSDSLWLLKDSECIFLITDTKKQEFCQVNTAPTSEIEDIPWDMIGTVGKRYHTFIEANAFGQFQTIHYINEVNLYGVPTSSVTKTQSLFRVNDELIYQSSKSTIKAFNLPEVEVVKCRYKED